MEQLLNPSRADQRRRLFHHPPTKQGLLTPATPYLTLPFRWEDLSTAIKTVRDPRFNHTHPYHISEGFCYSQVERKEHGHKIHGATDFMLPYGMPVVAPCDGLAMASFLTTKLEVDGQPKVIDGQQMWWGLGLFVQIFVPGPERHVRFAHLSDLAPNIPFSPPVVNDEGEVIPTHHNLPNSALENHPMVIKVKRGDLLGYVGISGMGLGWNGYIKNTDRPIPADPTEYRSYDEVHLHFEEGRRLSNGQGAFGYQRDPYDIYLTADNYPTPSKSRPMGPEPLWILENCLPKFTD